MRRRGISNLKNISKKRHTLLSLLQQTLPCMRWEPSPSRVKYWWTNQITIYSKKLYIVFFNHRSLFVNCNLISIPNLFDFFNHEQTFKKCVRTRLKQFPSGKRNPGLASYVVIVFAHPFNIHIHQVYVTSYLYLWHLTVSPIPDDIEQ